MAAPARRWRRPPLRSACARWPRWTLTLPPTPTLIPNPPPIPNPTPNQAAALDTLAGNLLTLGALLRRRAVVPEVRCPVKPEAGALNLWKRKFFHTTRPVAARGHQAAAGDERCNWCPPRECWRVEHVTPLELEAEIASREAEIASPGTGGAGEAAAGLAEAEATAGATSR